MIMILFVCILVVSAMGAGGGCATIYQDSYFRGVSSSFGPGNFNRLPNLGFPNDAASSIKVEKGCKVTLYEHYDFKGVSKAFYAGNFFWLPNFGFPNDKASSLKAENNVCCVSTCDGLPDGDYQSCSSCNVYASCSGGNITDGRPCPESLVWDDVKKRCGIESSTCPCALPAPKDSVLVRKEAAKLPTEPGPVILDPCALLKRRKCDLMTCCSFNDGACMRDLHCTRCGGWGKILCGRDPGCVYVHGKCLSLPAPKESVLVQKVAAKPGPIEPVYDPCRGFKMRRCRRTKCCSFTDGACVSTPNCYPCVGMKEKKCKLHHRCYWTKYGKYGVCSMLLQ